MIARETEDAASNLAALRAVAGFSTLERALQPLALAATRVTFAAGEVLLDEGVDLDAVLVVGDGYVVPYEREGAALVARDAVGAGALLGASRRIVRDLRVARVVAESFGWLLRLGRADLERAASAHPAFYDALADLARAGLRRTLLREALVRVLGPLDGATLADCERRAKWVTLRRGEALFKQGDVADAWYVVASGRLRMVSTDAEGVETVLSEVARGEALGEAALLYGVAHTATPFAVRDTELIGLRGQDVEQLVDRNPRIALSIARALVRASRPAAERASRTPTRLHIAVVPTHPGVDDGRFAIQLTEALAAIGPTLRLNSSPTSESTTLRILSNLPDDHPSWLGFSAWLDERAAGYRFVVLEGDPMPTAWTARMLREADEVLILADATGTPAPSRHERDQLAPIAGPHHARRTLVLLHPAATRAPERTGLWLDARDVQRHLHVRRDHAADLGRLARTLGGAAVGLVLGAGGARGFAHIGTLRAMAEAGVPVDHIGGASFGALVGALHAMGVSPEEMMERARRLARMRPFSDFALPITSVLGGRRVERAAAMLFGDTSIEDLWVPYFCNSCDISTFRDVLHTRGNLAAAVLASSALPGVLPPQVREGRLHVDGGTTDMIPGATMRARSKGVLIAVDVSTEREMMYPLARYPTSWAALWRRLRRTEPVTLSLPELFMRAVSLGVARRTAEVARDADLFLRPPVERFGTVAVEDMHEIEALGYEHARAALGGFRWRVEALPEGR